jgi:hypothetical protein
MENPLSWDYLTSFPAQDDIFGPWPMLFLVMCLAGLIAGVVLLTRPGLLSSRRLMRTANAQRWGAVLVWIFSFGIFFFVVGWLQINPFSFGERIWLLLTLLSGLIAGILMLIHIRLESYELSTQAARVQEARARGLHARRPPRRSRNKKR